MAIAVKPATGTGIVQVSTSTMTDTSVTPNIAVEVEDYQEVYKDGSGNKVAFGVGQKASAVSKPTVLSTEQEAILQSLVTLLTAIEGRLPGATSGSGNLKVAVEEILATQTVTGSVSVSNFPATQPVSATSLPIPTGASTAANQATGNTSLATIAAGTPALGQAAMAASAPVTIASDQAAIPVKGNGGSFTNRSGSITTGGTSQQLMAANAARKYFMIQNTSAGDLWIDWGTPAVLASPSFVIPARGMWESTTAGYSTDAINVIGATTGQTWSAKEL